ncbi:unnamed protein product [Vitrella brassicaformis CCMP3155]|uniref:Uncharacterized protein n=2 Tax=Vitrella brassicaformis TaxID=1169539 RepID=A0A0G4H5W4_VITBC|nr:unnamed protein product [Vitrella brassicaformis CCMP3155]|eukprot:CEM38972.1 unnamed protein product [Vitrella brassicaformis CCMP3155]
MSLCLREIRVLLARGIHPDALSGDELVSLLADEYATRYLEAFDIEPTRKNKGHVLKAMPLSSCTMQASWETQGITAADAITILLPVAGQSGMAADDATQEDEKAAPPAAAAAARSLIRSASARGSLTSVADKGAGGAAVAAAGAGVAGVKKPSRAKVMGLGQGHYLPSPVYLDVSPPPTARVASSGAREDRPSFFGVVREAVTDQLPQHTHIDMLGHRSRDKERKASQDVSPRLVAFFQALRDIRAAAAAPHISQANAQLKTLTTKPPKRVMTMSLHDDDRTSATQDDESHQGALLLGGEGIRRGKEARETTEREEDAIAAVQVLHWKFLSLRDDTGGREPSLSDWVLGLPKAVKTALLTQPLDVPAARVRQELDYLVSDPGRLPMDKLTLRPERLTVDVKERIAKILTSDSCLQLSISFAQSLNWHIAAPLLASTQPLIDAMDDATDMPSVAAISEADRQALTLSLHTTFAVLRKQCAGLHPKGLGMGYAMPLVTLVVRVMAECIFQIACPILTEKHANQRHFLRFLNLDFYATFDPDRSCSSFPGLDSCLSEMGSPPQQPPFAPTLTRAVRMPKETARTRQQKLRMRKLRTSPLLHQVLVSGASATDAHNASTAETSAEQPSHPMSSPLPPLPLPAHPPFTVPHLESCAVNTTSTLETHKVAPSSKPPPREAMHPSLSQRIKGKRLR